MIAQLLTDAGGGAAALDAEGQSQCSNNLKVSLLLSPSQVGRTTAADKSSLQLSTHSVSSVSLIQKQLQFE